MVNMRTYLNGEKTAWKFWDILIFIFYDTFLVYFFITSLASEWRVFHVVGLDREFLYEPHEVENKINFCVCNLGKKKIFFSAKQRSLLIIAFINFYFYDISRHTHTHDTRAIKLIRLNISLSLFFHRLRLSLSTDY